jgi:hypothetical protein
MQKRLVIVKNEFHFFVLFLKPKGTKIIAFNDFRVFFNSAHFLKTQIAQFFTVFLSSGIQNCLNFYSILYGSRDISNNMYLFLTVCDNSVMTYIAKFRFSNFENFKNDCKCAK